MSGLRVVNEKQYIIMPTIYFTSKIELPLVVQFEGGLAVEQGGPRADLVSLLLDLFVDAIKNDEEINHREDDSEDVETFSKPEAKKDFSLTNYFVLSRWCNVLSVRRSFWNGTTI